jgi:hypothetical protein
MYQCGHAALWVGVEPRQAAPWGELTRSTHADRDHEPVLSGLRRRRDDRVYSLEVCDPVEAPTYEVSGVSVANFVTPAWFDPQAPKSSQFDRLGKLAGPFSLSLVCSMSWL